MAPSRRRTFVWIAGHAAAVRRHIGQSHRASDRLQTFGVWLGTATSGYVRGWYGGERDHRDTTAFLMATITLLTPAPSEQEIREFLTRNICRCTGNTGIVAAIQDAAEWLSSTSEVTP